MQNAAERKRENDRLLRCMSVLIESGPGEEQGGFVGAVR